MKIETKRTATLFFTLLIISSLLLILTGLQFMNARAAESAAPTGQRLRALAGPFYIGFASANDFWSLSDAATYQETARAEFNILTPENAMKWDSIHPQQTTYSFTQADQHVQWAQQNGMAVHGHTLVWHSQNPSWLTNGSWTSTALTNVLYDHIDTVMGHYEGQILVWDVVNEAFDDSAQPRNSVWRSVIGANYIDLAFQRARAADPAAKLIYNDYNIETINSKSTAVYNMVSDMKSRGIPIDGVGFQMHLTSGGIDTQSFADNMQRFAALGLEIYITEMDVRYSAPISQANLTAQANIYGNVLDRCLAQPACKALQVWGFTDKYSWVPDFEPGSGDALIFDANYNAKPAYYALQAQLAKIGPTSTPTPTSTRTSTPTRTPTFEPSSLKLQLSASGTDNNQQTGFRFRVQNAGSSAASNISARIYFTTDGSNAASNYVLEKYYDQSGVATVSGPIQATGSTYYFTVNYGTASLPAGGAWEYHTALHLNNWGSSFSSANDWWRASGSLPSSYTDWNSLPAYLNDSLTWGSEPGGGPTHTSTATGTMTRTPTATPSASHTPTPTTCPMATAEPLRVEPVTSPSDQTTQVITVPVNNSDSVTVALESGSFTVTGNFTTANPALVTVSLLPNTEHHLTVSAHIKNFSGPSGCNYGGYTISTRNDRYGMPLTIVQSDVIDPTLTPTPTITTLPPIIVEGYVRVGSSTGPGLPQVVITTWFGGPHGQVTTDTNGYYQVVFPRPLNQETVSLTPQLADYTFSPDSYTWILYSGDTGPFTRDFIATSTQSPACSPVTATITAPFTQDGAGTFCWQTSDLGSFINSWNLASLTINGVDFTNKYVSASSYPAKIDGFWYVSYTGNFPWSHFEAK